MAEYVDRLDASTIPVLPVEQRVPFKTVGEAFEKGWRQALEMVAMMESADVVEVVRCKDCIYWRGENDLCKGICIDFGADGYCSEGKRKDGGQDDV